MTSRTWILLDEAAMVDTPRMAKLLTAAGPAVIRAIGDDRQLPAIGPAGWYAEQLAQHPGAELTHVYRQRSADDVRDFTDLGAGKVEEALRSLDERGRIWVLDELGQRTHAIVDLYLQERSRGRSAHDVGVVLDGSNHVLDDVNRRIQRERLVMEEIGGAPLQVEATDDERRWQLYHGDHVVFREKVVTADEQVIRNGEHGEIAAIDHATCEATIVLERGRTVQVELAAEAPTQPVVPAYARHVAAFQGGELPVVIVSPSRHATRNSAYTAVTRAKEDVHIVIDRETYGERAVDGLIRDWSRVSEKRTAWSQLGEAGREQWARWKAGEEGDTGEPGRAPEPVRDEAGPVRDERPAERPSAPSASRPARTADRRDDDERTPDDATHIDLWHEDLAEVREAVCDLRDADAERAAAAADRETAEALVDEVDVEPGRRFGDLDALIDDQRQRAAQRKERKSADAQRQPPEPEPLLDLDAALGRPAQEEMRIDLDAALRQRPDEPEPLLDLDAALSRPVPEEKWIDLDAAPRQRPDEPEPRHRPPPEMQIGR